jgi:ubiquinone/menaquinone biosynthesis C-methylase UbiE
MFMDPARTLAACNVQTTDVVADFGAGSGFVSRAAAAYVPQGQVFAIEINRDLVARLTREVADLKLPNVHPIWGDIEIPGGSTLGDDSTNLVILSNIMFQLDDKQGCAKEAYRVVKTGGRVLVIDWSESFNGMGPASHHVFTKDVAEALFTHTGFTKLSESIPVGEHHYAILFKK